MIRGRIISALLIFSLSLASWAQAAPLGGSTQLLLVVAEGWNSTSGELRRFERATPRGAWRAVGGAVFVNLGKGGLGWGLGLHGGSLGPGPEKREGDGRAPAGVFAIGQGFAYDPAEAGDARLPVLTADDGLKCIDDVASLHYNRMVRLGQADKDWTSAEDMRREDGQYRLGALVLHNAAPVTPGRGSCIFLHVWRAKGKPSAGCTNMAPEDMLALLRWLDATRAPVMAQLPRAEYERLRTDWGLPDLAAAR